jgi:hypothetical protein
LVQIPDGYPWGRVRRMAPHVLLHSGEASTDPCSVFDPKGPEVRVEHLGKRSAVDEFESAVVIGILAMLHKTLPPRATASNISRRPLMPLGARFELASRLDRKVDSAG